MYKSMILFMTAVLVLFYNETGQAQNFGTAFTYQGRLSDGGAPGTGQFDFIFELYDAESVCTAFPFREANQLAADADAAARGVRGEHPELACALVEALARPQPTTRPRRRGSRHRSTAPPGPPRRPRWSGR